jgi:hypothetical protein
MKNYEKQYEFLKDQMFKATFNKWNPSVNTKRINKLTEQLRYVEKQVKLTD